MRYKTLKYARREGLCSLAEGRSGLEVKICLFSPWNEDKPFSLFCPLCSVTSGRFNMTIMSLNAVLIYRGVITWGKVLLFIFPSTHPSTIPLCELLIFNQGVLELIPELTEPMAGTFFLSFVRLLTTPFVSSLESSRSHCWRLEPSRGCYWQLEHRQCYWLGYSVLLLAAGLPHHLGIRLARQRSLRERKAGRCHFLEWLASRCHSRHLGISTGPWVRNTCREDFSCSVTSKYPSKDAQTQTSIFPNALLFKPSKTKQAWGLILFTNYKVWHEAHNKG